MRTRHWVLLSILAIGPVVSMLLGPGAHAQASACDQLKARLAARIDPSVRGATLETVPAGTPVPAGTKVIGTCEGGAQKVLLRRSGSAPLPVIAASAAGPNAAPPPGAIAAAAKRREAQAAPSLASPPAVASAAVAQTPPESPTDERAAPVPERLAQTSGSAASANASAGAREGRAEPVVEQAALPPRPAMPAPQDLTPPDPASFAQRASGFVRRYGYAIAALSLVVLGVALWPWLVHRSRYDASGLPRGPRIN